MLKFWSDIQKKSDTKIKGYIDIQRVKSNEDMKRHLGALTEDFQGKVKGVAEQFHGLNTKLDSHGKRFDTIEAKLNSHTEMIGRLTEDVTIIKDNVEFLKSGLKKKVDYDEFMALERRTRVLEAKVRR